jgi:hypothetical protein
MITAFEFVIQLSDFQDTKRSIASIAKLTPGSNGFAEIEVLVDSTITQPMPLAA